MKCPIQLLESLLADVGRLDPCVSGLDRDLQTIERRFEHEGIGFLTVALCKLCEAFDRGLALRALSPVHGFKIKPRTSLPELFWGLTSQVFDSTTGQLKDAPSTLAIKSFRQITRFFKKAIIDSSETILDLRARDDFYGKDKGVLEEIPDDIAFHLRRVSTYILPSLGLQTEDFYRMSKHGPGAVFEGAKGNQKWTLLADQIRYGFDLFPESQLDLFFAEEGLADPSFTPGHLQPSNRSRFCSVPKSVTARRGITVEPLMKQFYQQGLNTVLRRAISNCAILRQCLDLTDQSKNQKLAEEGSRTGEWATLDLSAASDLLGRKLVQEVFWQHSSFFERADQCRSLFEDNSPMKKFAGMGNATTFPVQSVVFAVVALVAILRNRNLPITRDRCLRFARFIRVFGDDIIVPSDDSHSVITLIERCGLKVNVLKSFTEGNFRESCGLDAYMGVNVTPVYHKLDPRLSSWNPTQIGSMVSTANQLWDAGYYSAADTLKNSIEQDVGKLPNVKPGSGALGWHSFDETTAKVRFSRRLFRLEHKVPVLSPAKLKDPLDGYGALMKSLLTPLKSRDRDHLKRVPQRYQTKISWRWMPVNPVKSDFLP